MASAVPLFFLLFVCCFTQIYCNDDELCRATAGFSLALLKESGPSNKNAFFSPASISMCLAMVQAGAAGETKAQINRVIFGGLPEETIYTKAKALKTKLAQLPSSSYELGIANAAYVSKRMNLLDTYKQKLTDNFNSQIIGTNFDKPEEARTTMNQWVEEKTKQKIKNLLPEGSITSVTKLVLLNAIYFKSNWQYQFQKNKSKELEFRLNENDKVNVTMMIDTFKDEVYEGHTDNAHVLGLPYKDESMIMYFVLPSRQFRLSELERNLTGEQLINLFNAAKKRPTNSQAIQVFIPKFKLAIDLPLKAALTNLNVTEMFGNADLSGITGDRSLIVSDAFHKAAIEVNEEGSEASAATAVVMRSRSFPPTFFANQPFLYAIVHKETKAILFFGRFAHPPKSA